MILTQAKSDINEKTEWQRKRKRRCDRLHLADREIVCVYYFICLDQMSPDACCCQPISAHTHTHLHPRTLMQGKQRHTHTILLPLWHAIPPTPCPMWKQSNCRPVIVENMWLWNISYSEWTAEDSYTRFTPCKIEDGQKWDQIEGKTRHGGKKQKKGNDSDRKEGRAWEVQHKRVTGGYCAVLKKGTSMLMVLM